MALGEKVNVGKSAVSKYERGEIQPSNEVLIKIAQELDCSLDFLLGMTDDPTRSHSYKKSDTEELGDSIKRIFVNAGMIDPDEEITPEFKEYASELIRSAIVLNKLVNNAPL